MRILRDEELSYILRFAVNPERQVESDRLILTLQDVEQIVGEGRLDSNGEGHEDARRVKRPARQSSPMDRGEWSLTQGTYWVTYSEQVEVPEGCALILQPHEDLLRNGLWHPAIVVTDWDRDVKGILITVAARGVRIAENTAISTGRVISPGGTKG